MKIYRIERDGFVGVEIGSYTTLEGHEGIVLQQVGTKVVHVYRRVWAWEVQSDDIGVEWLRKQLAMNKERNNAV